MKRLRVARRAQLAVAISMVALVTTLLVGSVTPVFATTTPPTLTLSISDVRIAEKPNSKPSNVQLSVTLTGSVTNTSTLAINEDLFLVTTREIGTRTELSDLLKGQSQLAVNPFPKIAQDITSLTPGETRQWSLTFNSDEVVDEQTSGVIGLGVKIGQTQILTAMPWFYFNESLDPTQVSIALQVATTRSHAPDGKFTDFEGDSAELDRIAVLITSTENSELTWIVDPALRHWLSDFVGTELEAKASDIIQRIEARTEAVATQVYGGSNVPGLIDAKQEPIVTSMIDSNKESVVYYLPPAGALSSQSLQALKTFPEVVPITNNLVVQGSALDTTPLLGKVDSHPLLISDYGIESCFVDLVDEFQINQCVINSIAMITAESPNVSRHILVVTPVPWNPSTSAINKLVQTMSFASWMKLTTLPTQLDVVNIQTVSIATESTMVTFSSKFVKSFKLLVKQANALETLFPDTRISTQIRNTAYLATSLHLGSESAAQDLLQRGLQYAQTSTAGVTVETSSTFTIAGQKAQLPITIVNTADQPVRVGVVVIPDNSARLKAQESDVVIVESGQRVTVSVPITILGSGSVNAQVNIVTTAGSIIGQGSPIKINSTAYQDFARNLVYAAFISLLLLASNNYRVRRRQSRLASSSLQDSAQ